MASAADDYWNPKRSNADLGTLWVNLSMLPNTRIWSIIDGLATRANAQATRIRQLEARGPAAPSVDLLKEVQSIVAGVEERLNQTIAALDEANAARAKGEVAIASLTAQVAALAERHQTAVAQHLDALSAHFTARFSEAAAFVETTAANARDAKAAAEATAAHLDELRGEFAAAREAIPRLSEQAVREMVEAIEQEPGVLALALGNAQTFTSTIAKTVER